MAIEFFKKMNRIEKRLLIIKAADFNYDIPTFYSHLRTKVRIHQNEFPSKERGFDCLQIPVTVKLIWNEKR